MADRFEVVRFYSSGIKCDTAGCGWHDDSVLDYPNWLNRPCPNCGGNLLTEKDFAAVENMKLALSKINRWCNKWLPTFLLRRLSVTNRHNNKVKVTKLDMSGDGKIRRKM